MSKLSKLLPPDPCLVLTLAVGLAGAGFSGHLCGSMPADFPGHPWAPVLAAVWCLAFVVAGAVTGLLCAVARVMAEGHPPDFRPTARGTLVCGGLLAAVCVGARVSAGSLFAGDPGAAPAVGAAAFVAYWASAVVVGAAWVADSFGRLGGGEGPR